MNAIDPGVCRHRCLRVLPRPRGSWIVASEREVLSEHSTATEAENAAWAHLRDGDALLVVDRYHRCHRLTRPEPIRRTPRARISAKAETNTNCGPSLRERVVGRAALAFPRDRR